MRNFRACTSTMRTEDVIVAVKQSVEEVHLEFRKKISFNDEAHFWLDDDVTAKKFNVWCAL